MKHVIFTLILFFSFNNFYAAEKQSIAYVSLNGNDKTNNGSKESPYRTIREALKNTNNDATIIIRGGDYNEQVNISEQTGRRSLIITSYSGELVRLLCGEKIDKAEKVSGFKKVLKQNVSSCSNSPLYKIFQHDIDDQTTLIQAKERHPLQRGKIYRCNSTPLIHVSSIEEIESSEVPAFYYDEKTKTLYFSCAKGSDLSKNPIHLPIANGLYGGNNEISLNVIGIEILYGGLNLSKCSGARIIDCAAKYAFAGGGFSYNMSVGIEFIRCEATRCFTSSGNGDGFNGHSSIITGSDPTAKHTTVSVIDCWSHDNYDDGYSNHERCEGTVRGGLFEYNHKFGVGSAFGAHEDVFDVISRNNDQFGFGITADITENEGGYASQMILHNCISEGNKKVGYLANTSNKNNVNYNSMLLFDCYSINNKVGFEIRDKTLLELVNCKDSGSETIYKGTPIIKSFDTLKKVIPLK